MPSSFTRVSVRDRLARHLLVTGFACLMGLLVLTGVSAQVTSVLHISPTGSNEVQTIVNTQSAGSYFDVSMVTLSAFNAGSPPNLNDYDVIIIGLIDGISPPLGRNAAIQAYLQQGNGLVLTHGTACPGFWENIDLLEEIEGLVCGGLSTWYSGTISVMNDHEIRTNLFSVPTTLSVAQTHTVSDDAVGGAQIVYRSNSFGPGTRNFYLTVYTYQGVGRVAYNQIGHAGWNPASYGTWEQRLFLNCLRWAGDAYVPTPTASPTPAPVPATNAAGLIALIVAFGILLLFAGKRGGLFSLCLLIVVIGTAAVHAHPGHDFAADLDAQCAGLEEHVDLAPDNLEYRISLANVYTAMERYQEAEEQADWIVNERPDEVDSYLLLANIQLIQEDFSSALATYARAIERFPERDFLYSSVADIHERLGNRRERIEAMRKSLDVNPNQPVLRDQLRQLENN